MMDYWNSFFPNTMNSHLFKNNVRCVSLGIADLLSTFFIICLKIFYQSNITFIIKRRFFSILFILCSCGSQNSAFADSILIPKAEQMATISKSSIQRVFNNTSGITRANVTAGTGNLQQNSAAISIIDDGFNSVARVKSTQLSDNPAIKNLQLMSADIGAGAFDGARGMASINQSAGADNTQLNAMAIAVGGVRPFAIVEMNETQLLGESQAAGLSQSGQAGNTSQVHAVTGLSKDAFHGARGVIQVNQAAGLGNLTRNSFTMSVSK